MKLFIQNQQRLCRPKRAPLERLTRFFCDRAGLTAQAWTAIGVILHDDAGITTVNRLYLDRAHITDVICFRLPPLPGRSAMQGEIHINLQLALLEGRRRQDIEGELALYLAHGVAHLSGLDDATAAQRRTMRHTEKDWLTRARQAGLLSGLLTLPAGRRKGP